MTNEQQIAYDNAVKIHKDKLKTYEEDQKLPEEERENVEKPWASENPNFLKFGVTEPWQTTTHIKMPNGEKIIKSEYSSSVARYIIAGVALLFVIDMLIS